MYNFKIGDKVRIKENIEIDGKLCNIKNELGTISSFVGADMQNFTKTLIMVDIQTGVQIKKILGQDRELIDQLTFALLPEEIEIVQPC